jgi:fructokinase
MSKKEPVIIAAVEGGGTSFVIVVAELVPGSTPKILVREEVDSSHDNPLKTLDECCAFFEKFKPSEGYHALGLATFGPAGLDKSKPTYGHILSTSPKQSWRNVDLITPLAKACRGTRPLAVQVETDVNAPALAEYQLAKDSLSSVAYITVGTGIGVGLVIHGQPVHGMMHPEGGHVPVQPLKGDSFSGYSWGDKSPFKGVVTVEGLTSSVALTERLEQMLGKKNLPRSCLAELEDDHELWDHAANALANLCVTLVLTTSIEKIVIGGGVMKRKGLIEKIRKQTVVLLNGYLELPPDLSNWITTSTYGNDVGLTGAMILAQRAHEMGDVGTSSSGGLSPFLWGVIHGIVLGVPLGFGAVAMGMILARPRSK